MSKINKARKKTSPAFTIVELLVVIVVIGILAAITIVSYNGISTKAITTTIKSDLNGDSKLLQLYNVDNGFYPSKLDSNSCPKDPAPSTSYCLKASKGNTILYTGGNQSFMLIITNTSTGISYKITESGVIIIFQSVSTFVLALGGTSEDRASSIIQTSDGGYAIAGDTASYGAGSDDAFIAKYASDGMLTWSKTRGSASGDGTYSMIQTSDGGYAIAGYAGYGASITKYTSDGTLSWSKTWGGTGIDEWSFNAYSIIQTSDGGYAIAGEAYNHDENDPRDAAFIAKYASDGTLSWSKTWGGAYNDANYANSIIQTSDGGYAIAGVTPSYGAGNDDTFIAKYTSDGTLSWSKTWGGTGSDQASSIIQTSDGGYAIAGNTDSYGAGSSDAFIAKYTSSGTLSWSKTWGGTSGSDYAFSIIQTSDGGYAITGDTSSYGAGSDDAFIAKYTSSGTLSWSKTWGGTGIDQAFSIIQTSDGGYAITGDTSSYGAGNGDVLIAKYKSDGTINGCSSPMCQSVSPTVTSPSPTVTSPSPIVTSLSAIVTSLSPTVTSPSATSTVIVAPQ